jgi:O-antigen ligase
VQDAQQTSRWSHWLPGVKELCLALFLSAGYFKADPRLAWMPVDLTLLSAGLTVVFVMRELIRQGTNLRVSRSIYLVVLLFTLFLPSLFWTEWHAYAQEKVSRFYTLTLLATVAPMILLRVQADLRRFLNALSLLGGLMVIDAAFQLITQGDSLYRLTAFGSNTIALGHATGLMLIWVAMLTIERRVHLVLGGATMGALALILLASGSRGPLISTGIALVVTFVLLQRQSSHQLLRFVTLMAAGAFAVSISLSVIPQSSLQRVQSFINGQLGGSEEYRLQAWRLSWNLIQESPLGIGLGGFVNRINLWSGEVRQFSHNIILEALLEGGWAAGLCLTALLITVLARTYRLAASLTEKTEYRALFAVVVFLIANEMVSGELNDSKMLFAFMGLALGLRGRVREQKQDRPSHVSSSTV